MHNTGPHQCSHHHQPGTLPGSPVHTQPELCPRVMALSGEHWALALLDHHLCHDCYLGFQMLCTASSEEVMAGWWSGTGTGCCSTHHNMPVTCMGPSGFGEPHWKHWWYYRGLLTSVVLGAVLPLSNRLVIIIIHYNIKLHVVNCVNYWLQLQCISCFRRRQACSFPVWMTTFWMCQGHLNYSAGPPLNNLTWVC